MEFVEPKVYLLAKTSLCSGLKDYLEDIGSPAWTPDPNVSDGENLIEAAGRMCYRSWQAYDPEKPLATNKNVVKVREGNQRYIKNILESRHGSVVEHVSLTFLLQDVSRVFTAELCRHRAGMAYSEASLRYIRLGELRLWLPKAIRENPVVRSIFRRTAEDLEAVQKTLGEVFHIDDITDFHTKKELTSAFRRLAPIGLGTSIVATGNLRAWRHIITLRTSLAAEEEARFIVGKIAEICKREYPNVFQDLEPNANGEWITENVKV